MPLKPFDDCPCNPFFFLSLFVSFSPSFSLSLSLFLSFSIYRTTVAKCYFHFAATCRFIWRGDYTRLLKRFLQLNRILPQLNCEIRWLSWKPGEMRSNEHEFNYHSWNWGCSPLFAMTLQLIYSLSLHTVPILIFYTWHLRAIQLNLRAEDRKTFMREKGRCFREEL